MKKIFFYKFIYVYWRMKKNGYVFFGVPVAVMKKKCEKKTGAEICWSTAQLCHNTVGIVL